MGSVDNITSMEFKRYDSSSYQMARNASEWGKADPSLEDTVNGILKFMHRKGIISVEARETKAATASVPVPSLCPFAGAGNQQPIGSGWSLAFCGEVELCMGTALAVPYAVDNMRWACPWEMLRRF